MDGTGRAARRSGPLVGHPSELGGGTAASGDPVPCSPLRAAGAV